MISVSADGWLAWPRGRIRCALGRSGLSQAKREGDGATPVGCFPLRRLLFRPDRLPRPLTALSVQPIALTDGWCDDPRDPAYNRPVILPYPGRSESLWREDPVYDVIVVLGHNDDPVTPGAGSAIFLHVARPDLSPTEGCVAVALPDLLRLVADCDDESQLCIGPLGGGDGATFGLDSARR